jgi:hypothetical protein
MNKERRKAQGTRRKVQNPERKYEVWSVELEVEIGIFSYLNSRHSKLVTSNWENPATSR